MGPPAFRFAFQLSSSRNPDFSDNLTNPSPSTPVTPSFLLSSPLDATSVAPAVTVNQDTATAPQNETAIAVNPNNPRRSRHGDERLRDNHLDLDPGWFTLQRIRRFQFGNVFFQRRRYELVLRLEA
jgi:hypothetical protein